MKYTAGLGSWCHGVDRWGHRSVSGGQHTSLPPRDRNDLGSTVDHRQRGARRPVLAGPLRAAAIDIVELCDGLLGITRLHSALRRSPRSTWPRDGDIVNGYLTTAIPRPMADVTIDIAFPTPPVAAERATVSIQWPSDGYNAGSKLMAFGDVGDYAGNGFRGAERGDISGDNWLYVSKPDTRRFPSTMCRQWRSNRTRAAQTPI